MVSRSMHVAPANGSKRGSEDEGVMATASLELSVNNRDLSGPSLYDVAYTRGGWIWKTTHRYRDWLALKEILRADFGARNLPEERLFPKKEDMGSLVKKLLSSCQGCREGSASVGILEERRRGLQAYFSEILAQHRDMWDASDAIKEFFFPGPPTLYSAALSRRRIEQLKEEKLKAKEAASASSSMASSLKSTFGSIFESSTPSPAPAAPSPRSSFDTGAPAEELRKESVSTPPSMLGRISAKMPSLRDFLFDTPSSRSSSRHGTTGGSRHRLRSVSTNVAPSESGITDPDGISDTGGSKHSSSKHSIWD